MSSVAATLRGAVAATRRGGTDSSSSSLALRAAAAAAASGAARGAAASSCAAVSARRASAAAAAAAASEAMAAAAPVRAPPAAAAAAAAVTARQWRAAAAATMATTRGASRAPVAAAAGGWGEAEEEEEEVERLAARWQNLGELPSPISGHHLLSSPTSGAVYLVASGTVSRLQLSGGGGGGVALEKVELEKASGSGGFTLLASSSLRPAASGVGGDGWVYAVEPKKPMVRARTSLIDLSAGTAAPLEAPGPCPLVGNFRVTAVGDAIIAVGTTAAGVLDTVRWQPGRRSWEHLDVTGDIPPVRQEILLSSVGQEVFLMQKSEGGDTLDTYIYDDATLEWTFAEVAGAIPQPAINASLTPVEVGGVMKLVLFGGTLFPENLLFREHSAEVAVLDTETLTWEKVEVAQAGSEAGVDSPPSARSLHAAAATGDGRLIIAGGKNEATSFADVFTLSLEPVD